MKRIDWNQFLMGANAICAIWNAVDYAKTGSLLNAGLLAWTLLAVLVGWMAIGESA